MTINIALATYDGIILGCDSLSSVIGQVIYPFNPQCVRAKDANGDVILDANGNPMISLSENNISNIATTVFGGVNKVFCLYKDDDTCVVALTSGLATLGDVTIAEQARRYKRKNEQENTKFTAVKDISQHFLAHMRQLWEQQFEGTPETNKPYLPSVNFLLAGYGANDSYGMIFKLDISLNQMHEQFPDGDHMGICWSGQADYVERLTKGIDNRLVFTANKQILEVLSQQREATIMDISNALEEANVELPEGLNLNITEHTPPGIPWDLATADIDFGNLSTQYAIDLVELLVNTQSGMQRFARGIPTVGGRTHIGVIKRGEGFSLLNEPNLLHKHTGYADEF
jgi:hypothetical protein